jgi:GR25 family glycosyltransferase involved in LPS biosynthesis
MFHKLVDNVYVINLKKSKDRLKNIQLQCHKVGTKFELVEAVDGVKENVEYEHNETNSGYDGWTQGAAGLVYTTMNIIKDAKEKGYKSIMIMEDDIVFRGMAYKIAKDGFDLLPDNWELFHLAAQHIIKPRFFGKLFQLRGAWSCQIYALSERIYDEYLEWLELVDRPIDSITSNVFHKRGNSYSLQRDIIDTIPNWSTIRQMNINYGVAN